MKTLNQVEHDIQVMETFLEGANENTKKSDFDKLRFFRKCKEYLETNPSEDFVKKEATKVLAKIEVARNARPFWDKKIERSEKDLTQAKVDYNKDVAGWNSLYDVPNLNRHKKTLKYLLS